MPIGNWVSNTRYQATFSVSSVKIYISSIHSQNDQEKRRKRGNEGGNINMPLLCSCLKSFNNTRIRMNPKSPDRIYYIPYFSHSASSPTWFHSSHLNHIYSSRLFCVILLFLLRFSSKITCSFQYCPIHFRLSYRSL